MHRHFSSPRTSANGAGGILCPSFSPAIFLGRVTNRNQSPEAFPDTLRQANHEMQRPIFDPQKTSQDAENFHFFLR